MPLDILVIKLGGSVITDKTEKFSIRRDILKQAAHELASVREKFVLVHGGGSFGHPVASKYDISSGYSTDEQLMGFSETRHAMEKLNSKVVEALLEAGRPAVAMQTSACTVVRDDEIVAMDLRNARKLIELGITPIFYGDAVPDLKKGMTVLSGDQLVAFLSQEMEASKAIIGVDTDGIYTGDPKRDENAELIPKITPDTWKNLESSVDLTSTKDVTGGIKNKVEVLLDLAEGGIESRVINATKLGKLKRAIISDKRVGTKITKE